jgi:hypothetical protein
MGTMSEPEYRWLTYREVADALRLPSPKAALNRSRREGWPRQENNLRMATVRVPVELIEAAAQKSPAPPHGPDLTQPVGRASRVKRDTAGPPFREEGPGVAMVLAELRVTHAARIADFEQRLGRAEREVAEERAAREAAQERALRAEERLATHDVLAGELRQRAEKAEAAQEAERTARQAAEAEPGVAKALRQGRAILAGWIGGRKA